jgi:hypothetical protein
VLARFVLDGVTGDSEGWAGADVVVEAEAEHAAKMSDKTITRAAVDLDLAPSIILAVLPLETNLGLVVFRRLHGCLPGPDQRQKLHSSQA